MRWFVTDGSTGATSLSDREETAEDRGRLILALRVDVEQLLVDLTANGMSEQEIRDHLIERSNETVDLPVERVRLLVSVAQRAKQGSSSETLVRQDEARLTHDLGEPFVEFLAALGPDASVGQIDDALRSRIPMPGIGVRRVGAVVHWIRTGEPPAPAPVPVPSRTRRRSPGAPAAKPAPASKQEKTASPHSSRYVMPKFEPFPAKRAALVRTRPVGSKGWANAVSAHLKDVLNGSDPRAFVRRHVTEAIRAGATERDAFEQVRKLLVQRGARAWLTGKDIYTVATKKEWWSITRDYRDTERPGSSTPRGFWGGIANERYVRPVSGGGLPSLGKRR
jgi:hypothetical protein